MNILIREYKSSDAEYASEIWNQVVEDGVAFPQEESILVTNLFVTVWYRQRKKDSELCSLMLWWHRMFMRFICMSVSDLRNLALFREVSGCRMAIMRISYRITMFWLNDFLII